MPETSTAEGFIVRTVEYGDRDIIATIFGRETGVFSAIAHNAKGSQRRFGGGLQPMRRLEVTYTPRRQSDLARLESIEILEDFPALASNFDKIAVGSYATDLVRKVAVEERPSPDLYRLLDDLYARLAEASDAPSVLEVVLRHFQLRIFENQGMNPALDACFRCGRAITSLAKLYAMRTGEGIVCQSCLNPGDAFGVLFEETLRILHYWRRPDGAPPRALNDETYWDQARRLIESTLRRLIDPPLESRDMLDSALPELESELDRDTSEHER